MKKIDKPSHLKLEVRENFGNFLNSQGLNQYGVELGVRDGINAMQILTQWKGRHIYLIDSWEAYKDMKTVDNLQHIDNLSLTARRLLPFGDSDKISILKMNSIQASKIFPDEYLDWIYIDAAHDYMSVYDDLDSWYNKVISGGIIAGHDWQINGVKSAVKDFFEFFKKEIHVTKPSEGTSWWVKK